MNKLLHVVAALAAAGSVAWGEEVVYVVNSYVHGTSPSWSTLAMLRGSDLEILGTLTIGDEAHSVARTADGSRLWVTCKNSNQIAVIDAAGFSVVDTIDAQSAFDVVFTPDGGRAYVACEGTGRVEVFDTETLGHVDGIEIGGTPSVTVITPDGAAAYVVDYQEATVTWIRTSDNAVIGAYHFGGHRLQEARISPDGTILYVCNEELNRIERISLALHLTLSALPVAPYTHPRGLEISPDGDYLFVGHGMGVDSKVTMWQTKPFWALCGVADIPSNGRCVARNADCTRIYVSEHNEDECHAYRVNLAEESIFADAVADLNTVEGRQASPVGVAVGDWEPPPIDLTADRAEYGTTDAIAVTADVRALTEPCWPFVRVLMADGTTLYYERGRGFTDAPTPYLGFAGGPVTLGVPIEGYPVLEAAFSDIPSGAYVLEGGAVDAGRTTSAEALVYWGAVDLNELTVN